MVLYYKCLKKNRIKKIDFFFFFIYIYIINMHMNLDTIYFNLIKSGKKEYEQSL